MLVILALAQFETKRFGDLTMKIPMCMARVSVRLAVPFITICVLAAAAPAAVIDWTNPAGGDFSTAANWNGGAGPVPGATDSAQFNLAQDPAYTVTLSGTTTNNQLLVMTDKVSLALGGNTYTVTNAIVGVAGTDNGQLWLSNGTVSATGTFKLGNANGTTGTLNVAGPGNNVTLTAGLDYLFVGAGGTGVGYLNVTGGASLTNNRVLVLGNVANSNSAGHVTVSGSGTTFTTTGSMFLGYLGTTTSTIDILSGARFTTGAGNYGMGYSSASSRGSLNVDGAGSVFSSGGNWWIGRMGIGRMTVQNGGSFIESVGGPAVILGSEAGSAGYLEIGVIGSGSFTSSTFNVGRSAGNSEGHVTIGPGGTLTLQNGGTVYPNGEIICSNGTMNVVGGGGNLTLIGSGALYGSGTMNMHSGFAFWTLYDVGVISPGSGSAAGAFTVNTGDLVFTKSGVIGAGTLAIQFDSSGAHDSVILATSGRNANLASATLDYSLLNGTRFAPPTPGFMDFLIAPTISNFVSVASDNITNILSAVPFVQYTYGIVTVGAGDYGGLYSGYQALRLTARMNAGTVFSFH